MVAKGLGSKAGTSEKVRSQVWGEIARSDRGFEVNRHAQVVAFWSTAAVGLRLRSGKARSGHDCGGKNYGLWWPKTTAERTKTEKKIK